MTSKTFTNPVIPGFNPDPTVCVVPGSPTRFFLSTSTFEFFPGCAIYSSTDLITWDLIGHALTRKSQIDLRTVEPGAGSWASTLRYRAKEKRFYLFNGLFQRYRPISDERIFPRGFYVWTDNIWDENSWSDPIYFDNPGFDQDVFWDDDGKAYLSTTMRLAWRDPSSNQKDFAIHISSIDLETGNTLTAPQVIRQSPHGIAEGSHIFKRGAYYYLLTAEGGTEAGHREYVFRSQTGPLGPWEGQDNALWYNGPEEEVQRTGHADVFEDGDGRWWAVFLGVRPVKDEDGYLEPQMGRETFLVRVDWHQDWPVFNGGKNITLQTEGHAPIEASRRRTTWQADLKRPALELGWYQKNTPLKQCYTLTETPGRLTLYGNCFDLSSPECPAMLLRKQTAYRQVLRAKMRFQPRRAGYHAGLVLWWSQYAYATVGVVGLKTCEDVVSSRVATHKPQGKAGEIEASQAVISDTALKSDQVEMRVEAKPDRYHLHLTSLDEETSITVLAKDLTVAPPVGGSFTGVMFGVFAYGKNEPVLDPAEFWDISIEGF